MAHLIQVMGGPKIDSGEFDQEEIFIGRDHKQNDIVILDNSVSRRHARVFFRDGACGIEDLESRNQTLVNGAPIEEQLLAEGDRIQIGSVAFLYRAGEDTAAPPLRVSPAAERPDLVPGSVAATQVGAISPESRELGSLQRDHEYLYALYTVGKQITEEIEDTDRLLERILSIAIREVKAERGFIGLRDVEAGTLQSPEIAMDREGNPLDDFIASTTITGEVFESQQSILTEDALNDEALARADSIVESRILSAMCVPLLFRKESLGVLYVDNNAQTSSFSKRELLFLTCIADLAGIALGNASLYGALRKEATDLRARLGREVKMVGKSPAFLEIVKQIDVVASSDMTVLVTGESGTGKELVARALHRESDRRDGPFIPVNCAAIPDTLIESELFGYAANSGISGSAPQGKPGKFELADKGTIFLDEIGDMRLDVQATILRVLQDQVVERLGGTKPVEIDVRIVAATNKNLEEAIRDGGGFRPDLFYRLNRFTIHLPPLRERPEDVELLVEHFVQHFSREKSAPSVSAKAMNLLRRHSWPGNIRELEAVIERALLFSGRSLSPDALPPSVRQGTESFKSLKEVQEEHVRKVLHATGGVIAEAARILGISRKTLHEKVKLFGIDPRASKSE